MMLHFRSRRELRTLSQTLYYLYETILKYFALYLYNIKQYFLSVSVLSGPSGNNFQDTDVWFSVKDSKSQGAGVSAFYIPLLLQVNP